MRHPHGLRAASGNSGWDLSAAIYNGTPINFFTLPATQGSTPNGVFFKDDGTKFYVTDRSTNRISEYNLSTAWEIDTASLFQFRLLTAEGTGPEDLFFKPDGTKLYIISNDQDEIDEYNLSTAWDISTASYLQSRSVSAQETNPASLFFKPDGTKLYVLGNTGDDVNEYNLSIAWDISTANFLQVFSVAGQQNLPTGLFFKPDGTKFYITGQTESEINEYNLSTAWNISTASFLQVLQLDDGVPNGVFFKDDGTKFYIAGDFRNVIYEYDVSTAWDISTASWTVPTTNYFSTGARRSATGLFFKPDGTKLYASRGTDREIKEYNLSTAWEVSTASSLQVFSVAAQETSPQGLFFKPDGTKLYVLGDAGDDINEYNLSIAWDISTASFLQVFSVAAQDTFPTDLFFKPDGTKLYVLGSTGDDVNEYNLSIAWDVSTASFLQVFSVAGQESSPQGLFFKPDGTKLYVLGSAGDDINEYNLSTAWDISTASFLQVFSVAAQTLTNPSSLFFKRDGTKLYVMEFSSIWSYDL
jgi:DNA-binding beta-propeller fold protein YncE